MAGLGVDAGFINVLIGPKLVDNFAATMGDQLDKTLSPVAEKAGSDFNEKLGKSLTKTGAKLTAGLTVPIAALGALSIKTAIDMDNAFDAVRVKTGLTGKEFDNLTTSMKNVSKNVPQSLMDIGTIMSDISIKTGLAGKPLENLTTQFAQLNKVTGKELNAKDTIDAFKLLGVNAKDYGKSLDKLLRASQVSGVGVDVFTNTLKSQASTLNTLGFTFDKSVSYIATFSKAGLDAGGIFAGFKKAILASTKSGEDMIKLQGDLSASSDAYSKLQLAESSATAKLNEVKSNSKSSTADIIIAENNLKAVRLEMNKVDQERIAINGRITETTKSLTSEQKDAPAFFDATINKIKEYLALGNETEALKVAGVFGKSAIGIIDAIKQGGFEIQAVYDKIAFGSETVASVYKGTLDFTDQAIIFKKRISEAFGEIGLTLFPALEKAINTLLPPIVSLVESFSKLDPNVQALIIGALAFTAAIGPIVTTVGGLITGFAALSTIAVGLGIGLGALIGTAALVVAAIAAIGVIIYVIIKYPEELKAALLTLVAVIKEMFTLLVITIMEIIAFIPKKIFQLIKLVSEGVLEIVKGAVKLVILAFDGLEKIAEIVGKVLTSPFVLFGKVVDKIFSLLPQSFQKAKDKIVSIVNSLKNILGNVFNAITNLPGFTKLFSVLGALGGIVAKTIGTRATGGPVSANAPYLVGEKGPEIIVPRSNGFVVPNNAIGNMGGSNYNIVINNPTSEPSSTSIPNALRRVAYLKGGN